MQVTGQIQRIIPVLVDFFGYGSDEEIEVEKRIWLVTVFALIGIVFGLINALFNLSIGSMALLGEIELAIVVLGVIPTLIIGRMPTLIGVAEAMLMISMMIAAAVLIGFGGPDGTGLYWIYSAPFLGFFLKGQRIGWWYSLGLLLVASIYFLGAITFVPHARHYSNAVISQFMLALCCYTIVAASFNTSRTKFAEQLQRQVTLKTADATQLLKQLQFVATHDMVTKLPNKVLLLDIIGQKISATNTEHQLLVVCNLRLERLFEMSNILGVGGADDLTLKIARYLKSLIKENDLLAHTRRDEFIISYHTNRATFSSDGLRQFIAERQNSFEVQGYFLYCEFTLGFAIYPDHASDPTTLLNKAEQAMLQAQKSGSQWSIFDQHQEHAFVRHHLLSGKLREALMQQHFQVFYQPKIDLSSGNLIGAEALLRWRDPVEGFISPLEFIPVAEESGLIRPLTTWLVGQCMHECDHWHQVGIPISVSINISAMNLIDPDLLHVLIETLCQCNLAASSVNLEITESCFMASPERALDVIQRLHMSGFRLSIDDFGTGYSSLSYLKNLPINELKIDQSFVRNLLQNCGDQAIVSSTIDLAHNFGLEVVAEGIEDEPTSQWLQARGCDIGQGYFFARPMAADLFLDFALINKK
ncbi:putative bifunctional diguanylate cyclase/phosphodiesterase [Sapientia aquatica]|uniref:Phosphodiesterase n=1 Tax=Sapientia aquatica TaxID=1549640 RepID=A0A4R5VW76_9BURK|nr:GGDEF domain-containing phosphodiesterase [Sapientia aquatica]TDK63489.1 phosphodiesterase [Sapientia aquatica]